MLNFIDRSIKRLVAEEKGYMVIIERDHLHPGNWKFAIYKDTVAALGGELVLEKGKITSLQEAKKRSELNFKEILKNN